MGKSFFTIFCINLLWVSSVLAGGKCEIVSFYPSEKLSGEADIGGHVDIIKKQCAAATIRNMTSDSIYLSDYNLTATFADGQTKTISIHLKDMLNVSGREFAVSKCFGVSDAPIVKLDCQ